MEVSGHQRKNTKTQEDGAKEDWALKKEERRIRRYTRCKNIRKLKEDLLGPAEAFLDRRVKLTDHKDLNKKNEEIP